MPPRSLCKIPVSGSRRRTRPGSSVSLNRLGRRRGAPRKELDSDLRSSIVWLRFTVVAYGSKARWELAAPSLSLFLSARTRRAERSQAGIRHQPKRLHCSMESDFGRDFQPRLVFGIDAHRPWAALERIAGHSQEKHGDLRCCLKARRRKRECISGEGT